MLELAKETDWEAIQKLSVQIHDLHAQWRSDLYYHSEEPYPREKFLMDINNRLVYTAKVAGVVVGYVVLAIQEKGGEGIVTHKAMRVESICVEENARGQGFGKEIAGDVRALAKAFGCREVVLSVHPENDSAVGFYQKCGFTIRTIQMEMKV